MTMTTTTTTTTTRSRSEAALDFDRYLNEQGALVENRLRELTRDDGGPFALVKEAMEYSLFAGGKRIRPLLCLAACEACGGEPRAALDFGCALEMIHTYTLIHDDLPAMDNDDMRRGKAANHIVYGEAQALLAGCGLLTWAYEVMGAAGVNGVVPPQTAVRIVAETSRSIGWRGTMGGQSLDMIYTERGQPSLAEIELMEQAKTAKLLITAIRNGALAARADDAALARLTMFGEIIGLAFQVADDVLDVVADEQKLGKPVGSDARQGKTTYVDRLGLEGCRKLLQDLLAKALGALDGFGSSADHLRALGRFIVERAY
jgi:geranylgeranyl diphosphate synthase type II